ncbi:MAG: 50S ribosomal protein L25 [Parcubacteria group bacterium]|jgi:large subunit ribosomal protein L25
MVADLTLKTKKRTKKDEKVAGKGNVPGILYGKGVENEMIWVDGKIFGKTYEEAGESTILKLALEGGGERNVIVKDVQKDILTGAPIHVDFYQVRMDEEIEAEVELEFVGESPAVKELGGVLVKNMDKIEIKCLPGDLLSKIEVDISRIKTFDDYVYVKDLPIPEKVEVSVDPETVVAMVSEPRSEEELADLEAEVKEDVTQVEGVVKEEKPAEGEASEEKSGEKPEGKKE